MIIQSNNLKIEYKVHRHYNHKKMQQNNNLKKQN